MRKTRKTEKTREEQANEGELANRSASEQVAIGMLVYGARLAACAYCKQHTDARPHTQLATGDRDTRPLEMDTRHATADK